MNHRRILVTGGAGFIGSALVRHLVTDGGYEVLNLDKLSYAGSLDALAGLSSNPLHRFFRGDICHRPTVERLLSEFRPAAVMHLAAESHVDRSIAGPAAFIETNLVGTYVLLDCVKAYWNGLSGSERSDFRFHQVSTDEVFGDLSEQEAPFSETHPYQPHSPYSASKAGADHLARGWHYTYGLPVLVTHCSNNYGPYQHPEKLIPRMLTSALEGRPLPVYGQGLQIRDWLFVDDHVRALRLVLERGEVGRSYNIGGHCERKNIDVVHALCNLLEELCPVKPPGVGYFRDLITFVTDRPGHDRRYAMDTSRIESELDWRPLESFESGLRETVQWYLGNIEWCRRVLAEVGA